MRKDSGFTLLELLACLAIISVLFFFALPSSENVYRRNQVEIIVDELKNSIRYARNAALASGRPFLLEPLSKSDDWAEGMVLRENDRIIHQWQWRHHGLQVTWKGFQSEKSILFSTDLNQSTANGSFHIFYHKILQKKLLVNRLGRVRVEVEEW